MDFGLVLSSAYEIAFSMTKQELSLRTKKFALGILQLVDDIPQSIGGKAIAAQIVRSGNSVGANYRAACRAKSDRDFLNKMVILEEEADETAFWLELIMESGLMHTDMTISLHKEAAELTAIFTSSGKTVRQRLQSDK